MRPQNKWQFNLLNSLKNLKNTELFRRILLSV